MFLRMLLVVLALFAVAQAENVPEVVLEDYLAGAEPEADASDWKITLGLGVTVTDGNSRSTTIGFNAEGVKVFDPYTLTLKWTSTYGKSNGAESANEHIFSERLDWKMDDVSSLFQTLMLEHDNQELLRIRIVFAVGYTRQLIDEADFDLWVDLGPGIIYEDYRTTGENTEAIAVITIRFKWQLTEQLLYEQTVSIWPSLSDGGEGRIYAEAKFTTAIAKNWSLQLIVRDTYNTLPPAGLKKNDIIAILTLVMTF